LHSWKRARTLPSPLPTSICSSGKMETTGKRPNLISRIAPSSDRRAHRQSREGNRYPRRVNLPCKPETPSAGDFLKFDISAGKCSFRDQEQDRKEPELPQRQNGISDCPLYEFKFQHSSGHALLPLYTSWKFAVQEWRESENITLCESSLLPCAASGTLKGSGTVDPLHC
jgi:hypothetical protein